MWLCLLFDTPVNEIFVVHLMIICTLNLMGSNQNIYIPKNFVLYNNINNIVNNVTVLVHVVLCSIISISRQ